jgi:hypothetical protein
MVFILAKAAAKERIQQLCVLPLRIVAPPARKAMALSAI